MKTLAMGTAVAALGLLLLAGAAVARPQATAINVATVLTAAQEVPTPTGDVAAARGTFTATVTRSGSGATMAWQLSFSGLDGTGGCGARPHRASRPGRRRGGSAVRSVPEPLSGTANVTETVVDALESGGAYVNVHTAANAAGEIRGQLAVTASAQTALVARQEVPKPKGNANRARGTYTATVTASGTSGRMAWRLTFARLTGRALAAHVHIGARGKAGPVAIPLCGPCRSGVRGTATVPTRVIAALETGRAYVNVHTKRNPGGEIRGQLPALALRLTG